MKPDGPVSYREPCGDLFVCVARRSERENLALALRESTSPYARAAPAIAASQQTARPVIDQPVSAFDSSLQRVRSLT
jgi:hypothetical protein